jgi:hypothetical protein
MDLQAKIEEVLFNKPWSIEEGRELDNHELAAHITDILLDTMQNTIDWYTGEIQLLMQQVEDLEIDLMLQSESFTDKAEPIQPKRRTRF